MRKIIFLISVCCIFNLFAAAPVPHCSGDEAKVESLLQQLRESNLSLGDKIIYVARAFQDSPEDNYYTADSTACLRINVDSFSPLMFVNNVVALVKASDKPVMPDVNTFFSELENISCRRGENYGFPSIMYHTSDWIGDNIARGNLRELTEDYSGVVARTKSLDEMTRYRTNYAALTDSATFESVRMTEMGFRTHRVPTLKKETIKKKEIIEDLQNGDIIILVPNRDGIDCYDIGFVLKENGTPYFIHLSPVTHKIELEKDDLPRYMNTMTKHFQGYRILRIKE